MRYGYRSGQGNRGLLRLPPWPTGHGRRLSQARQGQMKAAPTKTNIRGQIVDKHWPASSAHVACLVSTRSDLARGFPAVRVLVRVDGASERGRRVNE
eukprot:scaffold132662_cov31-Prasinocladus_malaysianus.AAC.2